MKNEKIMITTILVWFSIVLISISSCITPKSNCGTKGQHKARQAKTKRIAPSMAH
jgi:hypothetical protein